MKREALAVAAILQAWCPVTGRRCPRWELSGRALGVLEGCEAWRPLPPARPQSGQGGHAPNCWTRARPRNPAASGTDFQEIEGDRRGRARGGGQGRRPKSMRQASWDRGSVGQRPAGVSEAASHCDVPATVPSRHPEQAPSLCQQRVRHWPSGSTAASGAGWPETPGWP